MTNPLLMARRRPAAAKAAINEGDSSAPSTRAPSPFEQADFSSFSSDKKKADLSLTDIRNQLDAPHKFFSQDGPGHLRLMHDRLVGHTDRRKQERISKQGGNTSSLSSLSSSSSSLMLPPAAIATAAAAAADEADVENDSTVNDNEKMLPPAIPVAVGETYAAESPMWFQIGARAGSPVVREDERLDVQQVIELGSKMTAFLTILAHSLNQGDKVLVFSQSLVTLDLIERILCSKGWGTVAGVEPGPKCPNGTRYSSWKKKVQYERLDGATPQSVRQELIDDFTTNKRRFLMLVSTRASGMGINLQAANRAVIFDSGWNPAHDLQAMHRCYRMGQKKKVFIYRLLSMGTMEEKIYKKQIVKQQLSSRVVDAEMPDNQYTWRRRRSSWPLTTMAMPTTISSAYKGRRTAAPLPPPAQM